MYEWSNSVRIAAWIFAMVLAVSIFGAVAYSVHNIHVTAGKCIESGGQWISHDCIR